MALMTHGLLNFMIALMSSSDWNLLIPHELRGSTETVSSPCVGRFDFNI